MTTGTRPRSSRDWAVKRWLVLAIAVFGFLGYWLLPTIWGPSPSEGQAEGGSEVIANSMLRIGIVMMALWLAMPSLRRPMHWLPPGLAAAGVILIAVVAAQPRLLLIVVPAAGSLLALRWLVRVFGAGQRSV